MDEIMQLERTYELIPDSDMASFKAISWSIFDCILILERKTSDVLYQAAILSVINCYVVHLWVLAEFMAIPKPI